MSKLTTGRLRAKAARYLRVEGHSLSEVGAALDVSKTQVARMAPSQEALTASFVNRVTEALARLSAEDFRAFAVAGRNLSGSRRNVTGGRAR